MLQRIYDVLLECIFFLVLSFVVCVPISGQSSSTAAVKGIVQDTSNAAISKVSVKLINADSGTENHTVTNSSGSFVLPGVNPGRYTLEIESDGFATTQIRDITLNVGDDKEFLIHLKVGSATESIEVSGEGLTLNTTDASVGTIIDRKFVGNIPLNGRSFQDLISMTPGIVTQSPQANSVVSGKGDFSVNGQRTESNYYTIDGVSANVNPGNGQSTGGNGTIASSTALGTTQSLISVDGLQEFRVSSSTYSAEYGHGPGGQFSFVTRSGSNTFHGNTFDYLRNDLFDANDWFNNHNGVRKSALRQNDFGGTIGGPILLPKLYSGKDRSFFFASYEGLRLSLPKAAETLYVPNQALRNNAYQALRPMMNAFPVPTGKDEMVPCTSGSTSAYPCPAGSSVGTLVASGLADFTQSYSAPAQVDSTSIRIDHIFSPKFGAFFRYGYTPSNQLSRSLSTLTRTEINTRNYTLGLTSPFTSYISNEFRLGYSSNDGISDLMLDGFGKATSINLVSEVGLAAYPRASGTFLLSFSGVGIAQLNQSDSQTGTRNWNITDSVSLLMGRHRIKIGLDHIRFKALRNPVTPAVYSYYFTNQSLIANQASAFSLKQSTATKPITYNEAVYFQDEWKIRPNISLSYGVRWEVDPAPHAEDGKDAYTLLGNVNNPSSLSLAPRGTSLWKTYWYNFAPRIGAAWRVSGGDDDETVIRAGVGVFFDTYNQASIVGFNVFGFSSTKSVPNGSLPVDSTLLTFPPVTTPPYTSGVISAFPEHLQVPYTLQWNVGLERLLGKSQSATISYVGANGRRLISTQSVSLAKLNSKFGTVYVFPGDITSNYQALQLKFQRTVGHGLQLLASYGWSHSIDFGSTYTSYASTRGNSDFDVRHNFTIGASWDLPNAGQSRISRLLVRDWGIDGRLIARSGFPITLAGNSLTDATTGQLYYSGVNFDSTKPIFLYGHQYPGGRAINGGPKVASGTAAFSLPSGTSSGNAPRNFIRGFGENQVNLALRRTIPLASSCSLQFRVETFNLLNHPNFGYINATLTNAQFGQATQMLNQSLGSIASQYQQGGPRSMQLAMKVVF